MTKTRIGVLGGIGPEATGEFYNKLINQLQERGLIKTNTDFPQILINSIPAPELIYDTISKKELEPYINGLKELSDVKVDFIVMVCNTIHLYHNQLQKRVKTEILDLRKELEKTIIKSKIKSALIIGTPNTINRGLYEFANIDLLKPNKKELKQLTKAIFNFNKGQDKQKQLKKVKKICQKYLDLGAETIILGCTEFAAMLDSEDLPKINTIDVLVKAVINRI